MDSNLNETLEDGYAEPAWKSKIRSAKQISYSRQNADKFLDKEKADQNRELYLDLFDQDPNKSMCNNKQFEQDLFSDIKDQNNEKPTKKRAPKKKKKDDENPEFLTDQYQRNLEKKKAKLQEIFEKSSVYQNLQALKDMPLNIEEVDFKGNVVKRYEYYFDYENDKHDIVELNNEDEDSECSNGAKSSKHDRLADETENEDDQIDKVTNGKKINKTSNGKQIEKVPKDKKIVKPTIGKKVDKQASKQIGRQTGKQKIKVTDVKVNQKRKQNDSSDEDDAQSLSTDRKRANLKSDQPQVDRPTRSARNAKRKPYFDGENSGDEEIVLKSATKRKRKTVK